MRREGMIALRVHDTMLEELDILVDGYGINRSELLRQSIMVGLPIIRGELEGGSVVRVCGMSSGKSGFKMSKFEIDLAE